MTPTRAKRNSKAPERFSSDDIKTDATNSTANPSNGDKTNSATKIKLKPVIREPLKVKLPKLRRLQVSQPPQQSKVLTGTKNGSIFAKIKLPSKKPIQGKATQSRPFSLIKPAADKPRQPIVPKDEHITQTQSDLDSIMTTDGDDSTSAEVVPETVINPTEQVLSKVEESKRGAIDVVDRIVHIDERSESGIRCPCGVDDDLGVMVECEKCSNWQHGHCINVGREEDAYEGYVCAYCSLPPGRQNDSLRQLVSDDKLQTKFETLESSMKLRNGIQSAVDGFSDQSNFTIQELETATHDLKRVSFSLEVKWKLLTSDDYNTELKIWKNPIWSDDPEENRQQQQQTVRFVGDIYKSNLKLNICNMLNRMHKRCQLLRYQISQMDRPGNDLQSKFDQLLITLDGIASLIEQVTDNLKTI